MANKPARRDILGARADEDVALASDTPARPQVEQIALRLIQRNGGTQIRVAISEEKVEEYAEALRNGAILPPIELFYDGTDYWLGDGFHRVAAHAKVYLTHIAAIVHAGTRRDAILHAAGANAEHGLPRTNADKRRAVETLLRDEEWVKWSDREIARRTKVHHSTVATIRKEMEASGGIRQIEERTVERGGTVYTQTPKAAPATPPASIADIEQALLAWLPTIFGEEADWPGVLADICDRGLGAFPSLRQALPECSQNVLRLAAEEVMEHLRVEAAVWEAQPSRVVIDADEPDDAAEESEEIALTAVPHWGAAPAPEPAESTPRGVQVGNVSRSLHGALDQLDTYSQLTGDFETPVRIRRELRTMLDQLQGLLSALEGAD